MTAEQRQALALAAARARMAEAESAAPPDQYQQAALAERDRLKAAGVGTDAGAARLAMQGATFNVADEILAAGMTPFEMVRQGTFNPAEGYRYAKAREDLSLDEGRKAAGKIGTAAEIGGGFLSGAGLARAGFTAGRALAPNAGILARSGTAAADAGIMGAVAGAGEGNTLAERGSNALFGGAVGTLAGGATPGAISLLRGATAPITSNIAAWVNPEGYATRQVARAILESSRAPQQIADDVAQAAREGQGLFTVADAMGSPGQRMLSSVTRAPGRGRTDVVEFLENRQAGQGRRVANALSEGFNAPVTANQARTAMTSARDTAADTAYEAVRTGAGRTDVVPVLNHLDRAIGTQPGQVLQASNDSIEGALRPFRERLARVNPDDFEAVQRIRGDMSDAAQHARQNGLGNRARMIGNAVRALDASMENASQGFRQANRDFAQASRAIDAVDEGSQAATRGRTEDVIPQFQGMSAPQQVGYRVGYADPLISQAQGAAFGVNKARPLLNDAFADEAAVIAPGNPLMQRRVGRENTMFETRAHALGGSRTADNLADEAAMGIDPSIIGNLLTGNWTGAARGALSAGKNALTGNTPEVRAEVGRLLTMRGGNVTPQQMRDILDQAVRRVELMRRVAASLGRGSAGALAVGPNALELR